MVLSSKSLHMLFRLFQYRRTRSIENVGTGKQLNVRGAGKETGMEVITYAPTESAENAQFILKHLGKHKDHPELKPIE
jgi:hypothetical protein